MSTIRSEIELRHSVSIQKADFQLHGFLAWEPALSLVPNPQQVLVHPSICVRIANPCISNGEEVIFVLTGTAGYPRMEAFVKFGRIMYDTNVRREFATTGHMVDDKACWATMCFISSLAASRLAFFSHDGGRHAFYG